MTKSGKPGGNAAERKLAQSSRATRSRRREKMRAELEAIFLKEGFRDLTIGKLAKRLRCSNRTLYEIAPSKEEMFLQVLANWLERIRHLGWRGALENQDPVERLQAFLDPGVSETKLASAKFVEDVRSYLPAKQMLARHQEERMHFLEEIVAEGIKKGAFKPVHPYLVAEVLLSAVSRIDEIDYEERAGLSFSVAFNELYELLLHGLLRN